MSDVSARIRVGVVVGVVEFQLYSQFTLPDTAPLDRRVESCRVGRCELAITQHFTVYEVIRKPNKII